MTAGEQYQRSKVPLLIKWMDAIDEHHKSILAHATKLGFVKW